MRIILVCFFLLAISEIDAQESLKRFYDLEVMVIEDSLYNHYSYPRKIWYVKLEGYENGQHIMDIEMKSGLHGDKKYKTGVLGYLTVINYSLKKHVEYVWFPWFGISYIAQIRHYSFDGKSWLKTCHIDPEGWTKSIDDQTKEPVRVIKYTKGEKYPDLSLAKTFTMYFYNLYNERVLKKGRN